MPSVRKGLRRGDVHRDTYGRLRCADCGAKLSGNADPAAVDAVRTCPDCGREWTELR